MHWFWRLVEPSPLVTPQNWLFLTSYKHLRKRFLEQYDWRSSRDWARAHLRQSPVRLLMLLS